MQIIKNKLNANENVFVKKSDEKVLVIEREKILPDGGFHGIKPVDFDFYEKIIDKNKQFLWRSHMELNPNYKQVIPYLVFNYHDKIFLMRRKKTSSERRLKNKYSLGIGGHIRQEDIEGTHIFDWAKREFEEEVFYDGELKIEPLGLLNDDSNDVGRVHIGLVFLLRGEDREIKIKSELQEGNLLDLKQAQSYYSKMESWSQIVYDYLNKTRLV
ncbi:MAG: hypothetical protein ABIA74_05315 [bacterium]